MQHSIAERLICLACGSGIAIESTRSRGDDCIEGFLHCQRCYTTYPILDGVAVIVSDFAGYASQRPKLLGSWLMESRSMREFLKENARRIKSTSEDRYEAGGAWFQPYLEMHSPGSSVDRHFADIVANHNFGDFYRHVAQLISSRFESEQICLEIGCAIGTTSSEIAKKLGFVFGVDHSFSFIREARKRNHSSNTEFLVANSLELPFRKESFGLIVSLNVLDLVDPIKLLSNIRSLLTVDGSMVLTDPYDFRDAKGDPRSLYTGRTLRKLVTETGFRVDKSTLRESFIPWILRIRKRAYLLYFADLIIAKKKRNRKR